MNLSVEYYLAICEQPFSERTADRLMQPFEESGTKLLAFLDSDGNPNSSLVTNLTYTQALILLGIPEEKAKSLSHARTILLINGHFGTLGL